MPCASNQTRTKVISSNIKLQNYISKYLAKKKLHFKMEDQIFNVRRYIKNHIPNHKTRQTKIKTCPGVQSQLLRGKMKQIIIQITF